MDLRRIGVTSCVALCAGLTPNLGSAQAPCSSTVSCAQAALGSVAQQKAIVEQLMKRVDDLEKISGRIETGTIQIPGSLRITFSTPFINAAPLVFVSLIGIEAFNLQRSDGTHLYISNIGTEKVDKIGATLKMPTFPGSNVEHVTLSWIAIGK